MTTYSVMRFVRSLVATRTSGTFGKVASATSASTPAPRLKITSRLGKVPSRPGGGFHTAT